MTKILVTLMFFPVALMSGLVLSGDPLICSQHLISTMCYDVDTTSFHNHLVIFKILVHKYGLLMMSGNITTTMMVPIVTKKKPK